MRSAGVFILRLELRGSGFSIGPDRVGDCRHMAGRMGRGPEGQRGGKRRRERRAETQAEGGAVAAAVHDTCVRSDGRDTTER